MSISESQAILGLLTAAFCIPFALLCLLFPAIMLKKTDDEDKKKKGIKQVRILGVILLMGGILSLF